MEYIIKEEQLKQLIENDFIFSTLLMDIATGTKITDIKDIDTYNFIEGYNCGHGTNFTTLNECINYTIQKMINENKLGVKN